MNESFNPSWNPSQTQTTVWIDATDSSTLTLSGSNITRIKDKSGSGWDLVPFAGTPTYSNNAINLDGNSALATETPFPIGGNIAVTIFAVYTKNVADKGTVFGWGSSSTIWQAFGFYDDNSSFIGLAYAGGVLTAVSSAPITQRLIMSVIKSPARVAIKRNAINLIGSQPNEVLNVNSTFKLMLGQWTQSAAGSRLNGTISEFIILNRVLSSAEFLNFENYLSLKYGIATS
ncbi:MAG: hypothetical protein IM613_12775 [Cytophagales bacterium]|nr:hypothetical protein [Cytophagales bacterium]